MVSFATQIPANGLLRHQRAADVLVPVSIQWSVYSAGKYTVALSTSLNRIRE
jgi:hypothetical protein